jgi:c-di-GMP-binding flagellar brake protein YcgR
MERRRTYRVPWRKRISCNRLSGFREPLDAETVDVSTLGVLLETTRPLSPGDRLELRLASEEPQLDVRTTGIVVRSAGRSPRGRFRSGVRFARMAELARSELGGFIAEQALSSGEPLRAS